MESIGLPIGSYEAGIWKHSDLPPDENGRDELTLATFNIWFGDHFAAQRYKAIARLLEQYKPDVFPSDHFGLLCRLSAR